MSEETFAVNVNTLYCPITHCIFYRGEQIYQTFLLTSYVQLVDNIYVTSINSEYDCDVFFPDIPEQFSVRTLRKVIETESTDLYFYRYSRPVG